MNGGRSRWAYRLLHPDLAALEEPELVHHYESLRRVEKRSACALGVFFLLVQAPVRVLRFDPVAYACQNLDVAVHYKVRQLRSHFLTEGQFDHPRRKTHWTRDLRRTTRASRDLLQRVNSAESVAKAKSTLEATNDRWYSGQQRRMSWGSRREPDEWLFSFINSLEENTLEALIRLHDTFGSLRPSYSDCFNLVQRISRREVEFSDLATRFATAAETTQSSQWIEFSRRTYWTSRGQERGPETLVAACEQQGVVVAPTVWSQALGEKLASQVLHQKANRVEPPKEDLPTTKSGRALSPWIGRRAKIDSTIGVVISLYRSDAYIKKLRGQLNSLQLRHGDRVWIGICDPSDYEMEEISRISGEVEVQVFRERLGIYEVWNQGARSLEVSYLTNMNADDFRPPNSIELQHKAIELYPQADVLYSPFGYIQDLLAEDSWLSPMRIVSPVEYSVRSILEGLNPPHNAPVWKRDLHKDLGYFRTDMSSASDAEFWVRALRNGKDFVVFGLPWSGYFDNPAGLSTRLSHVRPKAAVEHHEILLEVYARLPEFGLDQARLKRLVGNHGRVAPSVSAYKAFFS
jgi:hypothetical protein